MTLPTVSRSRQPHDNPFRHEALFYADEAEYAAATLDFLREGEPMLVVVDAGKIRLLRSALGIHADAVHFADMAEVGHNPARIIPAWRDFVSEHGGRGHPLRGIGEPVHPARAPAELVECQRHESLLNLAFDGEGSFRLLCPYDTASLSADVIAEARRSHPILVHGDREEPSGDYHGVPAALDGALPEPRVQPVELPFGVGALSAIRMLVAHHAADAGVAAPRTADLVLAVNEVVTNSLRHGGGGHGWLRVWCDEGTFVCEIHDRGRIDQPLIGRQRPPAERDGGRGLWMVNQLCDLVQIRSSADGTVVRMHIGL